MTYKIYIGENIHNSQAIYKANFVGMLILLLQLLLKSNLRPCSYARLVFKQPIYHNILLLLLKLLQSVVEIVTILRVPSLKGLITISHYFSFVHYCATLVCLKIPQAVCNTLHFPAQTKTKVKQNSSWPFGELCKLKFIFILIPWRFASNL